MLKKLLNLIPWYISYQQLFNCLIKSVLLALRINISRKCQNDINTRICRICIFHVIKMWTAMILNKRKKHFIINIINSLLRDERMLNILPSALMTSLRCPSLTCLRLQVDQIQPHVFGSLRVVTDLCIRVETKHFWCVCQRQRLNVV